MTEKSEPFKRKKGEKIVIRPDLILTILLAPHRKSCQLFACFRTLEYGMKLWGNYDLFKIMVQSKQHNNTSIINHLQKFK